jgi:nucleotide-binding universal stress UspA family protein
VDGTPACEPAMHVALDLAERRGARVQVLTVIDTRPAPIPPPLDLALALADGAYGESVHAQQKRALRASIGARLGRSIDWPVEVKLGTPSHAIAEEARRIGASLVVLGLRRHHALDRALNDETTLEVMRAASCPVLGVTPALTTLPRHVLVGVDFSRASLEAARAALGLVGDGGTIVLAYAALPTTYTPDDGERVVPELGVAAAFRWMEGELGAPAGMTIENVVLQHEPGRTVCEQLLGYADGTPVDTIALGSMRHGRVERWMLGSVTTDVARDGSYPLLVVPPGGDGRR